MKNRAMYIPTNSEAVNAEGTDAAIYVYNNRHGQLCARAFHGRKIKPTWSFRFSSEAARQAKIDKFIEARKNHAKEKMERTRPHDLKPGDIMVSGWGYDQTNIDFYIIVKATERTVTVAPIGKKIAKSSIGADYVVADTEHKGAETSRHVVNYWGNTASIKLSSYAFAHLWNKQPCYQTAASYGH